MDDGFGQAFLFDDLPEAVPSAPGKSLEEWFREFWQAVPKGRKVKVGYAERCFRAACRRASPEALVKGMWRYAERCRRDGTEPRYILHPSSWLNGRCWLDEAPTAEAETLDPWQARRAIERARAGR